MEEINRARELSRKITNAWGKSPLQIFIRTKKGILVRFTNNGVHQNGFQDLFSYTLRALSKTGPIWVESNNLSKEGIWEAIARLRQKGTVPFLGDSPLQRGQRGGKDRVRQKVREYFPLKLERIPEMAAQAIEGAVRLIRREQASANGYYSAYQRFFYLADSTGREIFHPATAFRFGVTITKGAGKGYFSFYHPDPKRLNVSRIVQEAMELAGNASRGEVSLAPGNYECVFSPRAFLELIDPLRRHFDDRLTQDGKSVFSGLLGREIFSKAFTLLDDIRHPGQFGVPFDVEGVPRKKAVLVEKGVLKELLAEGHSTRGISEHPFNPQNLVVKKGTLSRTDLFRRIRRGIFINKIWYHTLVREPEMEVTGLATAGSLSIEQGRIRGRVVHLRYHDSLFSILRSVVGLTKEQILLKDGEMGAALFPYLWVSRLRVV